MTLPKMTKFEKLGYLLGQYGSDKIDMDTFWKQMQNLGYTQADIDEWCDTYHKLEQEKDDGAQRRGTKGSATAGVGRKETR